MTTALKAEMAEQMAQQDLTTPAPVMNGSNGGKIIMQNFGDAEPVLDGRGLFEYGYCPRFEGDYGGWYEYPYDIEAVARLFRATSHHTSALVTKKNVLVGLFKPHPKMSRQTFERAVIRECKFFCVNL